MDDTLDHGDCHWFEVTLQVCCYEMARFEMADALGIRLGHLKVCAHHAVRAERFGWEVVACILDRSEMRKLQ